MGSKWHVSTLIRFWSFVDERGPDECWEWTGSRDRDGYGLYVVRTPYRMSAHRVSWELANHREVPEGMMVCHTCDNPPCVNPAHLYVGSHSDNARDRAKRNPDSWASTAGEANPQSKLAEAQVREIRRLYAEGGWTCKQLGQRYSVSLDAVWRIVNRRRWKHVE